MPTDLEIAQAAQPKRIQEIAEKAGIPEGAISPYGQYIAKVDPMQLGVGSEMRAKLILVTAINPTPAGEGKTTVSVGLADGMTKIGKRAMLALREPSLGPVFGMKGGAAGGGRAQVLPMEQINLHFTGDLHAITAANNLLAAMVDNHIQQGNALGIDPRQVTWRRCLDVNDRQLRAIVSGLGGKPNGNAPRGRLRHYRRKRSDGGFLPGEGFAGLEGAFIAACKSRGRTAAIPLRRVICTRRAQ